MRPRWQQFRVAPAPYKNLAGVTRNVCHRGAFCVQPCTIILVPSSADGQYFIMCLLLDDLYYVSPLSEPFYHDPNI